MDSKRTFSSIEKDQDEMGENMHSLLLEWDLHIFPICALSPPIFIKGRNIKTKQK